MLQTGWLDTGSPKTVWHLQHACGCMVEVFSSLDSIQDQGIYGGQQMLSVVVRIVQTQAALHLSGTGQS